MPNPQTGAPNHTNGNFFNSYLRSFPQSLAFPQSGSHGFFTSCVAPSSPQQEESSPLHSGPPWIALKDKVSPLHPDGILSSFHSTCSEILNTFAFLQKRGGLVKQQHLITLQMHHSLEILQDPLAEAKSWYFLDFIFINQNEYF